MNSIPEKLPHVEWLRDFQNWIWKRLPTRQLSATDIFYIMQWADSGVPCCIFFDGFESWILAHPGKFENDPRLATLQFEAKHIIAEYRKNTFNQANVQPLLVSDPYETALSRIAEIGRKTDNPLLREELRHAYASIRQSRLAAQAQFPSWNARSEDFYPFKAQALLDWDAAIQTLAARCFDMLAESEQLNIKTLSPAEQAHCMFISESAKESYIKQRLLSKVAEYFNFSELIEPL